MRPKYPRRPAAHSLRAVVLATTALLVFASGCSDEVEPFGPDPSELSSQRWVAGGPTYVGALNEIVTVPSHLRLGFSSTFPITDSRDESVTCASYDLSVAGTATLAVDMGADIEFSYDRADLKPGGAVPIQVTYTPTNDAGPEVTVNAVADVTLDVAVSNACVATLVLTCPLNPLCGPLSALVLVIETFEGELDDFDVIAATGDFTAPLGADPAVTIPGTGSTATLQFVGVDLVSATPVSSITLSPTPSGTLPGLGGASALLNVTGATLSSPVLPVLEWQASTNVPATIALSATPGESATLTLSPVMHWLGTSASLALDIDLIDELGDVFGDPSNITIFSGNLGTALGLDALICSGVPAVAEPACLTTVGAGNIPYPALLPQSPDALPVVPPLAPFAPAELVIDLDADDDGLLDGEEFDIGTDPDDEDTDNDGLIDGDEVKVHGCNPLVVDTDGDELDDAEEVNVYGTDCANPDTDGDELDDGLEVEVGTDPLDDDTDGDGIPDGEDVEWLQNVISGLPNEAFLSPGPGIRTAMLAHLEVVETLVGQGMIQQAIKMLEDLRERVDGCGTEPEPGDWIVECTVQMEVRALIDLYISNLMT